MVLNIKQLAEQMVKLREQRDFDTPASKLASAVLEAIEVLEYYSHHSNPGVRVYRLLEKWRGE